MRDASNYVDIRETHSGVVLLLGDRALKMKKPVDLGFLDFTDVRCREAVCRHEVELNSRLAPDVYLGVGRLCTPGGPDEPVVVMRRMPETARLTWLVRHGHASADLMRQLARVLAAFHARAERGPEIASAGTRDAISGRWEESFAQCRSLGAGILDEDTLGRIEGRVRAFLAGRSDLFDSRVRGGHVVDGHGDLLADDIFCLDDGPRILDCLEFSDGLRHLDQLDDVAFLAMDLEMLGASTLAADLLGDYLEFSGETAPPSLLHHFLAYRAFVRAKVSALRALQPAAEPRVREEARRLSTAADHHLHDAAVRLVLIGGPPGTGKSTLAGAVGDRLGMVVLSSDRLRKELAGVDPETPMASDLDTGIYSSAWTRRTYDELCARAERLLRMGESVVIDASWTRAAYRDAARDVADRTSSGLVGLQCRLAPVVAAARLRARGHEDTGALSDADERVAAALRQTADPWPEAVEVDMLGDPAGCALAACAAVRPRLAPVAPRSRSAMAPG